MERPSAPVNLLILTSKEEEAERIVTALRNGGLAVRGLYSQDPHQLEELIVTRELELILVCEYDPKIDLQTCLSVYREIEADVPLVVIADAGTDSSVLIDALRNGARDLTEHGDRDHLQLMVARELSDFRNRRRVRQLQRRLDECEQRARQAIDSSGDSVAYIQEGMHVQANPAYCAMFRFGSEDDLEGYPLLDLVAPDMQGKLRKHLRSVDDLDESASESMDLDCVRSDGSEFGARMLLAKSSLDGEPCLRVTVKDRSGSGDSAAPGSIDAETGLPNRTALMEELAKRLGSAGAAPVALIYVGVDIFPKLIHDESLTAGLEAMTRIAASLRNIAPREAFVARVGDDGFALLLEPSGKQDLTALSSKIVSRVHRAVPPGTVGEKERTCDTGVVLAEPGKASAATALDAAFRDYLLGTAEPEHKLAPGEAPLPPSASHLPDSGYHSELSKQERQFADRIKQALSGDGFQLVYQPIVSLKGDSQENYSVFLRLRDDEKRLREANEFLAAAVRTGRMVSVDRWVIDHAIAELARQRGQNRKVNFFVNIAEETLQQDALLIWICDQLRRSQARGNWLTVQVLGDHARNHSQTFAKLSEGLRKVKCRVAINRVGPGPNAEADLQSLRADFVKFTPEMTDGVADDESKQKSLAQLAAVARESGMKTVVTGVEDARTLTVLWTAGIDYVQGNFLQKPSPTIAPK